MKVGGRAVKHALRPLTIGRSIDTCEERMLAERVLPQGDPELGGLHG